MPVRVSAVDRIRTRIDALFAEDRELSEILEEVARLGAQLLMQAALEAEVTEFLGRERYQRAADAQLQVRSLQGCARCQRRNARGQASSAQQLLHLLPDPL